MTDIAGLLERVLAATGPDHAVDRMVQLVLVNEGRTGNFKNATAWLKAAERDNWSVPYYTASVDAALALVERKLPGWGWNIGHDANGELHATFWHGVTEHDEYAPTAPLAILAALLSALSSGDAS